MNERGKTRGGKHWDRRGASRPPPRRSCGRSGAREAGKGAKLGGNGVPGLSGLAASASSSCRSACWPFFCKKLPEKNRSPATCPLHLGAGVSSRVPTQLKPIGAEDWTERIFRVQFCRVAFKDLSSPRAHTPSPGRVPVR